MLLLGWILNRFLFSCVDNAQKHFERKSITSYATQKKNKNMETKKKKSSSKREKMKSSCPLASASSWVYKAKPTQTARNHMIVTSTSTFCIVTSEFFFIENKNKQHKAGCVIFALKQIVCKWIYLRHTRVRWLFTSVATKHECQETFDRWSNELSITCNSHFSPLNRWLLKRRPKLASATSTRRSTWCHQT